MDWMELLGLSGFEDFEQVELNELRELERRNRGRVLRAGRRTIAAVLATAMLLPAALNMTTTVAHAAEEKRYPPQATRQSDGRSADDPQIEIESNLVHDKYGFLTSTLELGIRVKSPVIPVVDGQGNPVLDSNNEPTYTYRAVQAISLNLAYNTQALHPVSWEWTRGDAATATYDVTTSVDSYYDLKLKTQKDSRIQTAAANSGIVADPTTAGYQLDSQAVMDGKQGLVHFAARAFAPEVFTEMTTIAVIRFAVDDALMEHIEIKKSGDDYKIFYDGVEMTDLITLQTAMTATATAAGSDPALPLAEFPLQKDIEELPEKASSLEPTLLHYSDEFTEMNYIPDYYDTLAAGATPATESVTRPINGVDCTLDRPSTAQSPSKPADWDEETLTLARKETAAVPPATDPTVDYSYTTNLIYTDNVKFTLVSKETFLTTVDENQTVLVYVDWDNKILGTQIVPKNTDVRGLVSDYVAKNFIYHDDDDATFDTRFDINDPAKMAAAATTTSGTTVTAEDIVSSLERQYSYRGKYPATELKGLDKDGNTLHDNPDTVVDEMDDPQTPEVEVQPGRKYPLTNKLDYVFLKRPMVHTDQTTKPDKTADKYSAANDPDGSQYQADYDAWYWAKTEWSQKTVAAPGGTGGSVTPSDAGDPGDSGAPGDPGTTPIPATPYWDTEHPYAYGWAQCTKDNYEDVWTTLGMGELGSTTAVTEPNAVGATKGYSGASAGGYRDINTTTNKIASVTYDGDAAFAFADLEKGFTQDEVFLKAVYEPGKDLLNYSIGQYRLCSVPYYAKQNKATAAAGGAYTAEMIYERSAVNNGNVMGVARMREPVVRQDTTADMKWKNLPNKGVTNDDMTNAGNDSAYSGKDETTYTKVEISNDELITVSITLSARQNKLDYYVADMYGSNFISHTPRSSTDLARTDNGVSTLDNYSYYDKDVITTPYYAANKYAERNGTRGFVLYGTLNNLLEAATRVNNGKMSNSDFNGYVTAENLQDANIYGPDSLAASEDNIDAIKKALTNVAAKAQEEHEKGNDMWWDVKHDHASLTYHQVQHFILSSTLYPDDPAGFENEGSLISWCRVHQACVDSTSDKPTTWDELIDLAGKGDTAKIELLRATEIENYFKLRSSQSSDGSAALWTDTTVSTFAAKVIAAVKDNGATTWDEVQYYLLNGNLATDANDVGRSTYWWYDCADSSTSYPAIENWDGLLTAAKDARTPVAAPDGSSLTRTAKLNTLEPAYDANKKAADDALPIVGATDKAWVAATRNLCGNPGDVEGTPFTSFDSDDNSFVKRLVKALSDLETADPNKNASPDWYQVQYAILNPDNVANAKPYTEADPTLKAVYDGFWWIDGKIKLTINNLKDLLDLAKAGGSAWDAVDFTAFNGIGLGFAKNLAGENIAESDYNSTIKAQIKAYADTLSSVPADPSWDEVQYYIIHNGSNVNVMNVEKSYYWWKSGNSKNNPDFAYTATDNAGKADELAQMLAEAYFKRTYNGYTDADSDGGTDFWEKLTAAVIEGGRLVGQDTAAADTASQYPSADAFPGSFQKATVDTVKTAVAKLFDAANPGAPKPYRDGSNVWHCFTTFTWEALQTEVMKDTADTPDYWWKSDDSKGVQIDPATAFKAINDGLADYLSSGDDTALKAAFTEETLNAMGFTLYDGSAVTADRVKEINDDWAGVIANTADPDIADYTVTAPLTWEQIQVIIMSSSEDVMGCNSTMDPDSCAGFITEDMGITLPQWYQDYLAASASFSAPRRNMLALRKPTAQKQAKEAVDTLAALKESAGSNTELQKLLAENEEYKALLLDLLKQATGEDYAPAAKPSMGKNTYTITPDIQVTDVINTTDNITTDDNVTVGADSVRPETETDLPATDENTVTDISASTNTATDETTVTDISTSTNTATDETPVTDIPASTNTTTDNKDNATVGADSVRPDPDPAPTPDPDPTPDSDADNVDVTTNASAADPPTDLENISAAAQLESVTDFRNPREGPPRIGSSLRQNQWRILLEKLAPITLLSRRTLA